MFAPPLLHVIAMTKPSGDKKKAGSIVRAFLDPTDCVEAVQKQILSELLAAGADCAYGRDCGFAGISDWRAYQTVPLTDYKSLQESRPGIWSRPEELTKAKLLAHFLTSGSSSVPKTIPVTTRLVQEKLKAFAVFWDSIYADHPALANGQFIANFADSGATSVGENGERLISETTFWNQRMQGFQDKRRWPLGRKLAAIKSAELRYYAAVRLALQGPLHCMMSLNPSTLVRFCRVIAEQSAALIRGLTDSTWGIAELDQMPDLPDELVSRLEKNVAVASNLEMALAKTRHFALRDIWPDLELIICWQSDLVEPYLRLLRRHTSGVAFRDYITQSSECIIAIPVTDACSGGLLAYHSHYYEFIHEEDVDSNDPPTVPMWELRAGQKYEVVVTTGGGLYRYRTADCIRVDEFQGSIPKISFQYRLGRTSSLTGEKLTEQHVLAALESARSSAGGDAIELVVFPRTGEDPHYAVLIPISSDLGSLSPVDLQSWLVEFEAALGKANGEYLDKRSSLRLGHPRVLIVSANTFSALQQRFRAAHVGDDQYKPGILRRERDLDQTLDIEDEIIANP